MVGLVEKGVRVYVENSRSPETVFRKNGCLIHDFPQEQTEGADFSVSQFGQTPYRTSLPIGQTCDLEVKQPEDLADIAGLLSCTAVFFMCESRNYLSVYAYHALSGTIPDAIIMKINDMMTSMGAVPGHSYALIYHPKLIDAAYKGSIDKLLTRDLIPANNYCTIFCNNGSCIYRAGTAGYFGEYINKNPALLFEMDLNDKLQLEVFSEQLREYHQRPTIKKAMEIYSGMKGRCAGILRKYLIMLPGRLDDQRLNDIESKFYNTASQYIEWRNSRRLKGISSRAFSSAALVVKQDLVAELLALVSSVLSSQKQEQNITPFFEGCVNSSGCYTILFQLKREK